MKKPTQGQRPEAKAGQKLALIIAGVGIGWFLLGLLGTHLGWSIRARALVDLAALAGFGWALWVAVRMWQARKE